MTCPVSVKGLGPRIQNRLITNIYYWRPKLFSGPKFIFQQFWSNVGLGRVSVAPPRNVQGINWSIEIFEPKLFTRK